MNAPAPPPEKRAILRFLSKTVDQDVIKLKKGVTIFGREKADVIIRDKEVSSTHCQVQYVGGDYYLFDMNSSNGTFVNKVKIKKHPLTNGDLITFGSTLCLFELSEEIDVRNVSSDVGIKKSQAEIKTNVAENLMRPRGAAQVTWGLEIQILYPDQQSQTILMFQETVLFGRGSSFANFEIDPQISRKHLIAKVNESGEVFVEDQGSSNGSFINGTRIQGIHMVRLGDQIQIGGCTLKIKAVSRSS